MSTVMDSFRVIVSKRCSLPHRPPLPIFKDAPLESFETPEDGTRYIGNLEGLSVTVVNYEAMIDLYSMGYFGKGSLSHGFPSHKCRKSFETIDVPDESTTANLMHNVNEMPVEETLHLMLEEAFFLSYGLGVLDVRHEDETLSNENMWIRFQNIEPNFIQRYVAYHYFRSKGWVVRPGTKLGGDFVLYKEGPPFYHASFVIIITSNLDKTTNCQGFSSFLTHYRAIEVVKKDLIICQIIAPPDLDEKNLSHLAKFKVSDYLFKRWIPSENRG